MRRRLAPLLIALAALTTVGATAAHASTTDQPWACIGETDIQKSVCLYPIVPDPPSVR